jgi:hypothetical protein
VEDRTVSSRAEKQVQDREIAGAQYGKNKSPYPDVFGDGVFIMNLAYIAQINPELPCIILFEDKEWKLLYCAANRTKEVLEKPYTINRQ